MATNEIKKLVPDVDEAAGKAENGLATNEALANGHPDKIALAHITAQLIHNQRDDLAAKQQTFNNRRGDKATAVAARQQANLQVGKELQTIRDALKKPLGSDYSQAWRNAGWIHNSLEIPADASDKITLLSTLITYFGAHPTHENAGMGATAEQAQILKTQLTDALNGVTNAQTPLVTAKNARNASLDKLHKLLMGLLNELGLLLEDDDARYYNFGFTPPALVGSPGKCDSFMAHPGQQSGTVELDWADADLAIRYQVQKQIDGLDADFVLIATVKDSDATIDLSDGTGASQTVRLRVRAVNNHGEGPWSTVLQVAV